MSCFPSSPRPETCPWGTILQADQLAPGIWSLICAEGGGLVLSDARQAAMPEALRLETPFYEETCDWALVILAFETELAGQEYFSAGYLLLACDAARCWHPERVKAHTGKAVEENTSYILKTRKAYLAAIGEYCTTSAWGDWAEWVTEGKTGVLARKLASVDHLGHPTYGEDEMCALLDKETYAARIEVTVLRDVAHEIIPIPETLRPKQIA